MSELQNTPTKCLAFRVRKTILFKGKEPQNKVIHEAMGSKLEGVRVCEKGLADHLMFP